MVALITGASSGLGHALALALAREGWDVAALARREGLLRELSGRIEGMGRRAVGLPCDVTDPTAVRTAVERCLATLGPVDLLVVNAGISESTLFFEPGFAEGAERILAVNVLGALYVLDAVLPVMLERDRGHVVAVGSLAGFRGLPLSAAYSASKGAMANLFESLRLDLRRTGVDVTLVRPGFIRTPMTDRNDHPMPWMVSAEDAAARVVRAIRSRRRSLQFPWPLFRAVWLAQMLPDAVYDFLASRVGRTKKE